MSDQPGFPDLQAIIAEILRIKTDRVQPGLSFVRDLGADSLDLVELVSGVEHVFAIKVPEEDLSQMRNIGDLWDYVQARRMSAV